MADTQFVDLLADDEQAVVLDADYGSVEVVNLGTAPVYARTDGIAATVAGDGCEVVLPNGTLEIPAEGDDATAVSLISATAGPVGVKGGPSGRRSGAGLATTSVAGAVEVANDVGNPVPISGTVAATVADGADVALGDKDDVAVDGDVAGTVTAKLRGLLKALGTLTDAGVVTDANGSLKAHARGLVSLIASIISGSSRANVTARREVYGQFSVWTGEFICGTSATQLPTDAGIKGIHLVPLTGKVVYVGKGGVTVPNGTTDTTTGILLPTTGLFFAVDNPNRLFIIGTDAAAGVTYFYSVS